MPATVAVLWLYSLILAYPLGFLPAILTGAVFAQLLRRRNANLSWPIRALLGAVLGACIALAFGLLFTTGSALPSLLRWGAAGALGGAVSGAAVSAEFKPEAGSQLMLGTVQGQVVRSRKIRVQLI